MTKITRAEISLVTLTPKVARSDAIQSFMAQETPIVRLFTDDGAEGTGYSYTIGQGGSSIVALLRDHLCPRLIGRDPDQIEAIWKDLFFFTHALAVGAVTALAIAAIDTALWDLRCRRRGQPLWKEAGGAQARIPTYTTEVGWLHLTPAEIHDEVLKAKAEGFLGVKIKVGRPHVSEDVARLEAVRKAVGPAIEIMTDANQGFTVSEAIRRARAFDHLDLAWYEEPLPAEDIEGHVQLARATSIPIAVGESLYHPAHFRDYLMRGACSIVQVDVARIGGITPWLKVAHLAETCNVTVAPHFLMELHVALCGAVPNARWVEYIPQLDDITTSRIKIADGHAHVSDAPGNGIDWNWAEIRARAGAAVVIA